MDKPYRKLRARLYKRRESEATSVGGSFFLRILVCTAVFLCIVGIRLRGGEQQAWLQNQLAYYLQGATSISEAYTESVEAFNRFCDRIVEGQSADD